MHWLPLKATRLLKMKELYSFFYGVSEVQTESGIENKLYQVQEGTEYLNENQTDNYVNRITTMSLFLNMIVCLLTNTKLAD